MQIIGGIRDGELTPGTRLPTVRELAGQINLAVNTVARAYRELEAAGILETKGRFGTFVARADPADAAMATAAKSPAALTIVVGILGAVAAAVGNFGFVWLAHQQVAETMLYVATGLDQFGDGRCRRRRSSVTARAISPARCRVKAGGPPWAKPRT